MPGPVSKKSEEPTAAAMDGVEEMKEHKQKDRKKKERKEKASSEEEAELVLNLVEDKEKKTPKKSKKEAAAEDEQPEKSAKKVSKRKAAEEEQEEEVRRCERHTCVCTSAVDSTSTCPELSGVLFVVAFCRLWACTAPLTLNFTYLCLWQTPKKRKAGKKEEKAAEEDDDKEPKSDDDAIDPKYALSSYRISAKTVQNLKQKGVSALFPIQAGKLQLHDRFLWMSTCVWLEPNLLLTLPSH
jgi:hypothetical protein